MTVWQKIKMFFGWKPTIVDILKNHDGPVMIAIPPKNGESVKTRFDKALEYVLKNEGPFSNNPKDPGGATQYGIIQTEYEKYLNRKLTVEAVRNMPLSTAKEIYRKEFWNEIKGDQYDTDSKAIAIFDTAVNKGIGGCMVCLRDALDNEGLSRFGEDTVTAVNMVEPTHFMGRFSAAVLHYIIARINKYPNMEWARKGWNNRALRLMDLLK